ncbi:MAG: hypothetical protein OEP52_12175, partial [Acidimicrobiia bacterium]|nr:hypothetical protein [Acidimicrobiia bacterium]
MRRRFLISTAIADLIALFVGVLVASLSVFGTAPWAVDLAGNNSLWPLIGFYIIGGFIGSAVTTQSWQGSAPRPTYGRALTIVTVGVIVASLLLIATGAYRSRVFFAVVPVVWLLGALAHRAVRRRRPWTESMIVISTEKGLIDDLRNTPHAHIETVLDPTESHPNGPPDQGISVVVDLRAVLSEGMAQYVSSCA